MYLSAIGGHRQHGFQCDFSPTMHDLVWLGAVEIGDADLRADVIYIGNVDVDADVNERMRVGLLKIRTVGAALRWSTIWSNGI